MKVLFVCDGNICRSPLAAEYLRHRSVREGLSHLVVDSAGLLGIVGAPAAPLSMVVGQEAGLDLTRHRSRGIAASDLTTADLVVAMTSPQIEALARRFPEGNGRRVLLRAFESGPEPRGDALELDDPVAGPVEEYRSAFTVIRTCVDHMVLHLKHAP
jgi:protein-tyrosine-phosphatase